MYAVLAHGVTEEPTTAGVAMETTMLPAPKLGSLLETCR
jgi:hypothetical protein